MKTRELAHRKPLLKELRETARVAAGVDEVKLERLERISPAMLLTFVALAGAVYFLYPQFAHVSDVFERRSTRTAVGQTWIERNPGGFNVEYVAKPG